MRKTILFLAVLIYVLPCFSQTVQEKGLASINTAKAEQIIGFLADDDLLGREAGTKECENAAKFLANEFEKMGVKPLGNEYFHKFLTRGWTVSIITRSWTIGRWVQMRLASDSSRKRKDDKYYELQNVLGMIEGENTDEYVIIGAHFDHLGIDSTLIGDQIYNGADDNASGVAAVIQIANAFLETEQKPARNIIFALWDGEEKGLLGSRHFVETFPEIDKVKGYLNIDMIGRNKKESRPKAVTYVYTTAYPQFGQWLKDDIVKYNLELEPKYRPRNRNNPFALSDNAHFTKKGIPIIWYFTGIHSDLHKPSDEIEKINWEKTIDITKASFLSLWNMANSPTQGRHD